MIKKITNSKIIDLLIQVYCKKETKNLYQLILIYLNRYDSIYIYLFILF